MIRVLFIGLIFGAVAALAQDRTQPVPEAGVVWLKTEIVPASSDPAKDDGGCVVYVYASNDAGIQVTPQPYPYNGARCTNVIRVDSLKAAKKDLAVGNGAVP